MKITIVGTGYVGLSLATLLSQRHTVTAVDIDELKVEKINNRISPINDSQIESFFSRKDLNLTATLNLNEALNLSEMVIIATPTNYNDKTNYFDTSSIELVLDTLMDINSEIPVIIKSTVPVGYTEAIKIKYNKKNIAFSPEFLREGSALYDNLNPTRIIVGSDEHFAKTFASLLKEASLNENTPVIFMNNTEAEAVKLFSNTYLAMRVAFVNELDTYAEVNHLSPKKIISGIGFDPRIGNHYNNPSFGYGGYCLPKDTKQLLANYKNVPQNIISAVVDANRTRKEYIVSQVLKSNPQRVGIYRLAMKTGSDNFRESAVLEILDLLVSENIEVILFEPILSDSYFRGARVTKNIDDFKNESSIILANRVDASLNDVFDKVYTRDVFNEN